MMAPDLLPSFAAAQRTAQQAIEDRPHREPVLELGIVAVIRLRAELRAQRSGIGDLLQQQRLLLLHLADLDRELASLRAQIRECRDHRIVARRRRAACVVVQLREFLAAELRSDRAHRLGGERIGAGDHRRALVELLLMLRLLGLDLLLGGHQRGLRDIERIIKRRHAGRCQRRVFRCHQSRLRIVRSGFLRIGVRRQMIGERQQHAVVAMRRVIADECRDPLVERARQRIRGVFGETEAALPQVHEQPVGFVGFALALAVGGRGACLLARQARHRRRFFRLRLQRLVVGRRRHRRVYAR